jgi:ketosteroid isomerase-like protein
MKGLLMRFVRAFLPPALGLAAALTLVPASAAPPPDPALTALPAKMAAALVANDVATLRANCAPSATVVDEFAPYSWSGPDACVRWAAAFKTFAAQAKLSGFKSKVAPNPFTDVTGGRAYVVAQVTFSAAMSGKPMSEAGTWTFVLVKSGAGWKAMSLAWGTLHH